MNDGNETETRIVGPASVDKVELSRFLDEAFGPVKSRFLMEHGDWWHRGPGGRLIATCDGVIAGYRGFMPTMILVKGKEVPAIWAIDLYVTPRFRGHGLQRMLDQRLTEEAPLRVSFPNATGAKIYVKQGYGLRDDLRVLHLPLYPRSIPTVQTARGRRKWAVRAGALGVSPLAAAYRAHARRYRPTRTEVVTSPDEGVLEDLFRRHAGRQSTTTLRSAEFLRWRYLEAPYREDLVFYQTTLRDRPTHYAIVRHLVSGDSAKARVLDVFGNPEDTEGFVDLMRTVTRDAAVRGCAHVLVLGSSAGVASAARSAGFRVSTGLRFRWSADDPAIHQEFNLAKPYWTLGDGEMDSPS
jgi:GNAT superfamily N-acetyltransferase